MLLGTAELHLHCDHDFHFMLITSPLPPPPFPQPRQLNELRPNELNRRHFRHVPSRLISHWLYFTLCGISWQALIHYKLKASNYLICMHAKAPTHPLAYYALPTSQITMWNHKSKVKGFKHSSATSTPENSNSSVRRHTYTVPLIFTVMKGV